MKYKIQIPGVTLHFREANSVKEMKKKSQAEMKKSFRAKIALKDITVTPWHETGITVKQMKALLANIPDNVRFFTPIDCGQIVKGARYDKKIKEVVLEFKLWPMTPS